MQRRHAALGSNHPPPPPHRALAPNLSQSSLKTPHPDDPHPHRYTHTQNNTKHDYVTKPVSSKKR